MGMFDAAAAILPGFGQMATGGVQAIGEGITGVINQFRNWQAGSKIESAGQGSADRMLDGINPELDRALSRYQTAMYGSGSGQKDGSSGGTRGSGSSGSVTGDLDTARDDITGARDQAMKTFSVISSFAKAHGLDALDQYRASAAAIANRIPGFEAMGDEIKSTILGKVNDSVAKNDQWITDLKGMVSDAMNRINTNASQVAGGTISGMQKANDAAMVQFAAQKRKEGWDQQDIDAEVRRMKEATRSTTAELMNKTAADTNNLLAKVGVDGAGVVSGFMTTAANSVQEGIRTALSAMSADADIKKAGIGLRIGLAQQDMENSLATFNYVSGQMDFAGSGTANALLNSASMTSALEQGRAQYRYNSAQNLAAIDQSRGNVQEMAEMLRYNSTVQGEGTIVGMPFQFPNIAGLMTPGFQMIQQYGLQQTQPQPQQPSQMGQVFGSITGGGASLGAAGIIGSALTDAAKIGAS